MKHLFVLCATLSFFTLYGQDEPTKTQTESRLQQNPFPSVITPNVGSLPWIMDGDVKVFHLVAEPVRREFAPGFWVNCWGYNGTSPGPTIEAVEGDRVRFFVTNKLTEPTTVHWHGLILPNGMDGVSGLTQRPINPGETFKYEFTLKQNGTFMYHPHADEMTQVSMGMEGFFIIHPKEPEDPPVDRDFAIMLHEWHVPQGAQTPIPFESDYNLFTFNSALFPTIEPLVAKTNQRVRVRFGNLMMNSHPIHLHGYEFTLTRAGAKRIPSSAQFTEVTVSVAPGATRDIEFVADNPGDWAFHCHKPHHTMNQMSHDLPNITGVNTQGIDARLKKFFPGIMGLMGANGMGAMFEMYGRMDEPAGASQFQIPPNLSPIGGPGPFAVIELGGMFTVLKVRDDLTSYTDPGWYEHPPGTSAEPVPDFPLHAAYLPNIHSPDSSPSLAHPSWFSQQEERKSPRYEEGGDWQQSNLDESVGHHL